MNTEAIANLEKLKQSIIPHGRWSNTVEMRKGRATGCVLEHLGWLFDRSMCCEGPEYYAMGSVCPKRNGLFAVGRWNDQQKSVWPVLAMINKAIKLLKQSNP